MKHSLRRPREGQLTGSRGNEQVTEGGRYSRAVHDTASHASSKVTSSVKRDRRRREAADHDAVAETDHERDSRERDDKGTRVDGGEDDDGENHVDDELVEEEVARGLRRAGEEREDSGRALGREDGSAEAAGDELLVDRDELLLVLPLRAKNSSRLAEWSERRARLIGATYVDDEGGDERSEDLRQDVERNLASGETLVQPESDSEAG